MKKKTFQEERIDGIRIKDIFYIALTLYNWLHQVEDLVELHKKNKKAHLFYFLLQFLEYFKVDSKIKYKTLKIKGNPGNLFSPTLHLPAKWCQRHSRKI